MRHMRGSSRQPDPDSQGGEHASPKLMRRLLRAVLVPDSRAGGGNLALWFGAGSLVIAIAVVIGLMGPSWFASTAVSRAEPLQLSVGAPTAPPVRVCDDSALLGSGPQSPPPNAIKVPAGDNSTVNWSLKNTTYWFAPGVHTLGAGMYTQIIPGSGSTYVGAPGAIIDGMGQNNTAFGGDVPSVQIEYLTIQNFDPPGNQGAVNASGANNWTIRYDTIRDIVPGTALYAGTNNVVEYNCLTENGQSGFGTYTTNDINKLTQGASNIDIDHNEISYNDTCNFESVPNFPGPTPPSGCKNAGENSGCGCSGGGKFWETDGGKFDDNWVHNNYSVGVWWDANNAGFDVQGNYIADNYDDGLIYETSYNALIKDNTFIRNALGAGATDPGFPESAIYISESGSDDRVPGGYGASFQITGNIFRDNWGGVVLWENSNRFCNSPVNTSTGTCTLVDPSLITIDSCNAANIGKSPYYDDCRWRTQNVSVSKNIFDFNRSHLGHSCTAANLCGFQGMFSEYGTYPSWSPYKGTVIGHHIAFDQNNHFSSNIYSGPWLFMAAQQGNPISVKDWRAKPYSQDAGSTFGADTP
jgi:hypothetical protein